MKRVTLKSKTGSAFLKSAMNYAVSKGLVVVAAAGNSPTGKPVYPAAYEPVIAVSARRQHMGSVQFSLKPGIFKSEYWYTAL